MRVKLSELRRAINQFLQEALEQKEDLDRLRRAKDGYGETEFEESVQQEDHTAHSKESGYTNEVEEASLPPEQPRRSTSLGNTAKAAQMQGVGPKPTLNQIFPSKPNHPDPEHPSNFVHHGTDGSVGRADQHPESPYFRKKEAAGTGPQNPQDKQIKRPTSLGNPKKAAQMQGVGPRPTMANAFEDPGKKQEAAPPPTSPQSSKVKVKDKSKMQGVGPRPTMANAFDDLGKKKQ